MDRHLLRVEGVNMAASVYDTQDLGAIQGASLALLAAPEAVRSACGAVLEPVFIGASQGLFRFAADARTAESIAEAARRFLSGDRVFSHLTFVVDVEAVRDEADEAAARRRVLSRNRVRQMRMLSLALPAPAAVAAGYCPIDRVRPGVCADREEEPVSFSVKDRRDYRRDHRNAFYETHIGLGGIRPHGAEDFNALVSGRARRPEAEAIRNKMAVIYCDGNGFGKIRNTVGDETFSRSLTRLRRELMAALLSPDSAYWTHPARAGWREFYFADGCTTLETLLWGGDEMMWAVPGWLAWPLLSAVTTLTADWTIEGHRLTHAGGVVICDRKTPIRQVKALAYGLVDLAKGDRSRSAWQIEVLESIDIPEGYLAHQRTRLFGAGMPPGDFTLFADDWDALTRRLRRCRARFPRSQLYRLLHKARAGGALTAPTPDAVRPVIAELAAVVAAGDYGCRVEDLVGDWADGDAPCDPRLMRLAQLATFWDYVDPFELGEVAS